MNNLTNYVNGFGQMDANGNDMFQVLEGNAVDSLTKKQKESYGIKALRMYWDALGKQKKPTATFDEFVDQVYWDNDLKQNFRDPDLADYGEMVAMYLLDHPYPDEDKLREKLEDLAEKVPMKKIPSKWGLGQAVVKASSETGFFDFLNIFKTAVVDSATEGKELFKDAVSMAETGAKLAIGYKVATALVLGLTLLTAFQGKKR